MNIPASARLIWCLKKSVDQRVCFAQLLRFKYGVVAAPTRSLCVSHCQRALVNQRIVEENDSLWKKGWKKIKYYLVDKSKMKVTGYYLYEAIADKIKYFHIIKEMNLPDTFNSWFLVTELHVWMIMTKSMELGEEGRTVSYSLVESMWGDVTMKCKKLGAENSARAMEQVRELGDAFHASLLNYDEGLLSDDKVLASALWRRFFNMDCSDPKNIETMVKYVRQQMHYLDTLTEEQFRSAKINWHPLEKIN